MLHTIITDRKAICFGLTGQSLKILFKDLRALLVYSEIYSLLNAVVLSMPSGQPGTLYEGLLLLDSIFTKQAAGVFKP